MFKYLEFNESSNGILTRKWNNIPNETSGRE